MKTWEHDFLFLEDRITEEHKKYSLINFVIMFSCLLNLYFEVVEEVLDGGVDGGVVVECVALWGAVDYAQYEGD